MITASAESRQASMFPGPTAPKGAAARTDQPELVRQRVYDPVLRIVHAWNALSVVGLIVTAQLSQRWIYSVTGEALLSAHVWLGFGLILGLVARLAWGLVGPKHARLDDLWHPREWAQALRSRQWFTQPKRFGHHAEASIAYIALYLTLLVLAVSGLVLAALEQNMGPLMPWIDYRNEYLSLFKAPHVLLEYVIMFYVVVHLGALVLHKIHHRTPVAQSMISGFQYHRRQR